MPDLTVEQARALLEAEGVDVDAAVRQALEHVARRREEAEWPSADLQPKTCPPTCSCRRPSVQRPPLAPSCEYRPDILVCAACGLRDLTEPHDCPQAEAYWRIVGRSPADTGTEGEKR